MATTPVPCGCTQLLEPDPLTQFTICSNAGSPGFIESGISMIPQGVSTFSVVFDVQKASDNYAFVELAVENLLDSNPLSITPELRTRTRDGFSVDLSGMTDSPNYKLRWNVYVTMV